MTDNATNENQELVLKGETLAEYAKKYRSLGGAVKANDKDAILLMGKSLLENDSISIDDLHTLMGKSVTFAKLDTVLALQEIGLDITENFQGTPLVFFAYENGNKKLALALIDAGIARSNEMWSGGETLLINAVQGEDFDFAQELVNRGADVNEPMALSKNTALHYAAYNGSFTGVAWLIGLSANPLLKNFEGKFASEVVPSNTQLGPEDKKDWDFDEMFTTLEQYTDAFESGEDFCPSDIFIELAAKENTAMTQEESLAAMLGGAGGDDDKLTELDEDDVAAKVLLGSINPGAPKSGF